MSADTAVATALDMGHGQTIQLSDEGDGRWRLAFAQAGSPGEPAPALDDVKVEAIDSKGQCRPMKMFPGPDASTVYASGPVESAYRARVAVVHGDHAHRREVAVPKAAGYNLVRGPNGGTLISMGHDSYVEVLPVSAERWKITFMDKDVLAKAPVLEDVKAEAIGDDCQDGQVRDLEVLSAYDGSSLILTGRLQDKTHLRLAVMMGDHYHTRCVPVLRP